MQSCQICIYTFYSKKNWSFGKARLNYSSLILTNYILFNTIEEAIKSIKAGKPIVVVDDENRENEGDLIIPAEKNHTRDCKLYDKIWERFGLRANQRRNRR
jgi:hypothetical protein